MTVPLEVGMNTGLSLDSIYASLGVDPTQSVAIAAFEVSGLEEGSPRVTWDTTQVTNGTLLVNFGAQLDQCLVTNFPPVSFVVSNQIWFPDSFNVAGWYIEVQAQSAHTNGVYHVDVYDNRVTKS